VLDPARSASSTVTVTPVVVVVNAAFSALLRGEQTTLTAVVTGTGNSAVTWTASCGTITGTGATVQYLAPSAPGTCTVRATSVRDPGKQGERPLRVRNAWRVAVLDDTDDGECTVQHCTLREAITAANVAPDRDSILIVGGATPATITLTQPLPIISTATDIVGPGAAAALTINAAATETALRGVLYINGDFAASVRGVTLRGGRRPGGGGLIIDNKANVTLRDVHVTDNQSDNVPGGGVLVIREGRGTFVNVDITNNRTTGANGVGAGVSAEEGTLVTMLGGRIADNVANGSVGGGARVFNSSLVLDSTIVSNNRAPSAQLGFGGAVFADGPNGTLSLVNATIEGNSAAISGGGLNIRGGVVATMSGSTIRANNAPAAAGIELGNARLTVVNSNVIANVATLRGGGLLLFGTAEYTQQGGSIRENIANATGGGGLYLQQTAKTTLTNVNVVDNRANGTSGSGAGIWGGNTAALSMTGGSISGNRSTAFGGAIFQSGAQSLTLTNVAIERNQALGGGGLFLNGVNVRLSGGRIAENIASTGGGGGAYMENATLVADSTTFAENRATQGGGAILALTSGTYTLRNVVADDNVSNSGGAYGFSGAMTVTFEGGLVRRNRSNTVGGGLWKAGQSVLSMTGTQVLDNEAGTQGGGLQLSGPGAAATLRRVTVSGNKAVTQSGGGVTAGVVTLIEESTFARNTTGAIGGALFAAASGNSTVRNSTFSANEALMGGGIAATGPATVVNATFVANKAIDYGAGIGTNNAGAATVTNILLAGNLVGTNPGNCGSGGASLITSGGGNLSGDATCTRFTAASDKPNTAPGVNITLSDNGGRTFTHALLEGSAAINAGVAASCPVADQRGFTRIAACDIGAFEFGGQPPAAPRVGATIRRE
jgi:CSLREA domain-containing protein